MAGRICGVSAVLSRVKLETCILEVFTGPKFVENYVPNLRCITEFSRKHLKGADSI